MSKIYVLHENQEWVLPLKEALSKENADYEEWFLNEGIVPLSTAPPEGIFYNRMSASSHTRGHRFAPELAHGILNWLEANDRRIVNGTRALYFEISKLAQYAALFKAGIRIPKTVGAVGTAQVLEAAEQLGQGPWILKPNRGGKGAGVMLFHDRKSLEKFLQDEGKTEAAPIDGTWLVQDYIAAPDNTITRAEFVGGKYLYSVKVDTSKGFDLCPADACTIEDAACPVGKGSGKKFQIIKNAPEWSLPLLRSYEKFIQENRLGIVGIEFIRDAEGQVYTYDINTNTNYNAEAEAEANVELTGMRAIAKFLLSELRSISNLLQDSEFRQGSTRNFIQTKAAPNQFNSNELDDAGE